MKYLRALVLFLLAIARGLLYGWALGLLYFFRLLRDAIRRWLQKRQLPPREGRMSPHDCAQISDPAYRRPDPMIYDQNYLMQQGFAVTWDNPDIELFEGGVLVSSHDLKPDTVYEVVARIWNNSTQAPALGLPVSFSYLSFGVGTVSHPIGATTVDLGVKGGANQPAFASVPWRTPATPGHYCIQVAFAWADDINPNNNLGQENTEVAVAHSAAVVTFELRNDTPLRQAFRFDVDTYAIPPQLPCDQRRVSVAVDQYGHAREVPSRHRRDAHPIPAGWDISFEPREPRLDPGESVAVSVRVVSPPDFHGEQLLNVHAFHEHGLAGGFTARVAVKD